MSTDSAVRVRFAPSPTGKLHIGGARTAIYNWAFARSQGGSFILRIDDTDPTRSTEENTQIILRALRWLGLDWDEGPDIEGDYGPYRQTDCADLYREAAQKLVKEGKAYYCFCSAEKLARDREAAKARKDSFQGYPRTCRHIDPAEAQARVDAGEPHTIRLAVPEDRGDVVIQDAVHGEVVFNARELDDFIIFRSDGTPTYNFATVVDDARMKISHVIRGDDHLSNTPRQVIVYEALGAETPTFAHISMILGSDGKKLSKRHGATSVEEYQKEGYLPDAFLNYLALLGWSLDGETTIIPREVLAKSFSLDHVSKNPAIMDAEKLLWMNSSYMGEMTDAEFVDRILMPELTKAGLEHDSEPMHEREWYELLASIAKPRCKLSGDVVGIAHFLYEGDKLTYDQKSVDKNLAKEWAHDVLRATTDVLSALGDDEWHEEQIDRAMEALPEKLDLAKRKVFQAIRVAVCGNQVSPPLGSSMELLGKEQTLKRIAYAQESFTQTA
ncbi:MAG: glutamate--tRNA ligase [Atopobiaceae bacterium]|nr:glutamate--tRNA ligase [Atopobiaceae bacterium]